MQFFINHTLHVYRDFFSMLCWKSHRRHAKIHTISSQSKIVIWKEQTFGPIFSYNNQHGTSVIVSVCLWKSQSLGGLNLSQIGFV
jgi:hypothetical protein